jgi:hypothetical protein
VLKICFYAGILPRFRFRTTGLKSVQLRVMTQLREAEEKLLSADVHAVPANVFTSLDQIQGILI